MRHEAEAAGAERDAQRNFFLARSVAREDQVDDIRAGDKEYESYSCELHEESGAQLGRGWILHALNGDAPVLVSVGEGLLLLAVQSGELRLCLLDGDARLQAREDAIWVMYVAG